MQLSLEFAQRYLHVVRVWLGPRLYIFLTDPDDAEVILNSQVHINKSDDYRFFAPWLGEGLLISSGMFNMSILNVIEGIRSIFMIAKKV